MPETIIQMTTGEILPDRLQKLTLRDIGRC